MKVFDISVLLSFFSSHQPTSIGILSGCGCNGKEGIMRRTHLVIFISPVLRINRNTHAVESLCVGHRHPPSYIFLLLFCSIFTEFSGSHPNRTRGRAMLQSCPTRFQSSTMFDCVWMIGLGRVEQVFQTAHVPCTTRLTKRRRVCRTLSSSGSWRLPRLVWSHPMSHRCAC